MNEKGLYYLSQFSENTSEVTEGVLRKNAELFSVGTHRGVEYTEEDLKVLADNFNKEDNIPLQLDHSESARDTVGYLESVEVKDGKLLGTLKVIDEYAQERIGKQLMNKLSISFYKRKTENGAKPFKLREVSLVAFPQVKGAQLFSENGYVSEVEEEDKGGKKMENFDLEKFKEEQKALLEKEMQEQFSELQKQVEAGKELAEKFAEQKVNTMVEKFQESKQVVPAQADSLKALLASFNEEQLAQFETFMSNASKVDFKEEGEFEQDEDKKDEPSEFDKFYEEYSKKNGMSL